MKKLILFLLIATSLSAQTVYRIRMPNRTWSARLIGVTGTGAAGDTISGVYDLKYGAHEFLITHTGGYDLEYIPTDGTEWLTDEDWDAGQAEGKFLVGSDMNIGVSHAFSDSIMIYSYNNADADIWLINAKGDSVNISMENEYYGDLNKPTFYINSPDSGRLVLQGYAGKQNTDYIEIVNDYFAMRPYITKDSVFVLTADSASEKVDMWLNGNAEVIDTLTSNIFIVDTILGNAYFNSNIETDTLTATEIIVDSLFGVSFDVDTLIGNVYVKNNLEIGDSLNASIIKTDTLNSLYDIFLKGTSVVEDTLETAVLNADTITTKSSPVYLTKIDTIKTASGTIRWLKLTVNGTIFYIAADTTIY